VTRRVVSSLVSEENQRLVRRALEEIYAKGGLELADEVIHPEFVDHEPAHRELPTGPEGVKLRVRDRVQAVITAYEMGCVKPGGDG
jgi:hypothetical protein